MSTANEQKYLDLLRKVLTEGKERQDRTGVGTYSLFGEQLKLDLREGFPLLTTKKIHFKSVVHELLWMISGSTNVKDLQKHGVTIWDNWRAPYTTERKLQWVPCRDATLPAPFTGDFSFRGISAEADSEDGKLASAWVSMMKRCYDPTHHRFSLYGGSGATVHPDWHDPISFIAGVKLLPHWRFKQADWNKFELDKDYFGAKQYGPQTSVWLRTDENNFYTTSAQPVRVTTPNGDEFEFITQADASRSLGISTSSLSRFLTTGMPTMLKGKNKLFAGYSFDLAAREDQVLRYELIPDGELGPIYGHQWRDWDSLSFDGGTDQLAQVIKSIKSEPYSRRHIVTAWNPSDFDEQALPPCHILFQFYVHEGQLSCHLYQRSADIFLGVPFNIASYALLTKMVANVTNLWPRELIISYGDLHLYKNHVEQAKEQLSREPKAAPALWVSPSGSLFDFKYDDFQLRNYEPHPAIPAPVAV